MNTAVAARVGTHRVTYEPTFGGVYDTSGLQLRVDGKVTTLDAQGVNLGNGGRVINSPSAGAGAIEVQFPNGKVLTVVPGLYDNMKYLDVHFSGLGIVSKTAGASDAGLSGPIPSGSWLPRLPDGKSVGPRPASVHDRYVTLYNTFGDAWRVAKNASLFDYAPGTSTDTFTKADWPAENATSCSLPNMKAPAPVSAAAAEAACQLIKDKILHSSCVFDVTATGHGNLADTYVVNDRVHTILVAPKLTPAKP